jgi:hypothetical protein
MGVLHSFVQADSEQEAQDLIEGFVELGLLPSSDFKPGRTPTIRELRQALDQSEGYETDFSVNSHGWELGVEAPDGYGVRLHGNWAEHSREDENAPAYFAWKGGRDIMLPAAQKLANLCGPIVIMTHNDLSFTFVFPAQSE